MTDAKDSSRVLFDRGGWTDVWPEFVHGSLAFVNPPDGLSSDGASALIKKQIEPLLARITVRHFPRIEFDGQLHAVGLGTKPIYFIKSMASAVIRELRKELRKIFEKHGFRFRLPKEAEDCVHITIRGRSSNIGTPTKPSDHSPLFVTFESLGVTPAAENVPVQGRRQHCGITSKCRFGPLCQVGGSIGGGGAPAFSLADVSQFPEPIEAPKSMKAKRHPEGSVRLQKVSQSSYKKKVPKASEQVIQPVEHTDPPRTVDPVSDASIAAALLQNEGAQIASWSEQGSGACCSAPSVIMSASRCLLEGTRVLMYSGSVKDVLQLQPGDMLWGGCAKIPSRVLGAHHLPQRDQDIVSVRCSGSLRSTPFQLTLSVTSSHLFVARQPLRGAFTQFIAKDLRIGDYLRTLATEMTVDDVECSTEPQSVIEIQLDDSRGTMFVADNSFASQSLFVEVFGKESASDSVQILKFRRFDRFREALLESDALEECRADLRKQGISADLTAHALGPGKLFVAPELALPAIISLHKLVEQRGKDMMQSEVVVSGDFVELVKREIQRRGQRANYVVDTKKLECSPLRIHVKHTFVDVPNVYARSNVTNSTTDAHLRSAINSRMWVGGSKPKAKHAVIEVS
jgi:hypothetical protein